MISGNCSVDEFVESVKGKNPMDVITIAVEEATRADRMCCLPRRHSEYQLQSGRRHARHLKLLIDFCALRP